MAHAYTNTHTLTPNYTNRRRGKGQSNKQSGAMTKLNPKQRTIKTLKAATLTLTHTHTHSYVHEMPLEMTRLNINKNTKWRKHATHRAHTHTYSSSRERNKCSAHERYELEINKYFVFSVCSCVGVCVYVCLLIPCELATRCLQRRRRRCEISWQ